MPRLTAEAALAALADPQAALPATLVAVAHPDDELVGAGSLLPRLRAAWFAYATDGAPRDGADAARHGLSVAAYRALRRRERLAAFAASSISAPRLLELGCADQQAPRHLAGLARQMARLYDVHAIDLVLTHPYEGGHPDHDATAFAVQAAAALRRRAGAPAPVLLEMASYHAGPDGRLQAGRFLPHPAAGPELPLALDAAACARKQAALACHASQRETLAQFPPAAERLRAAPAHDFLAPPHDGSLLYERMGWGGWSGPAFRAAAARACRSLGLEPPPWR